MKEKVKSFGCLVFLCAILVQISSCSIESRRIRNGKTIIYYAAANNNLSYNISEDISEMAEGYVPEKNDLNVFLVYSDIEGSVPSLKRVYRDRHGEVVYETIEEYEAQNSASPEVMRSVLVRALQLFRSEKYGLILSSHATGWLPQGYYNRTSSGAGGMYSFMTEDPYAGIVKSFGNDRTDSRECNIDELKTVLPVHFDFIMFDCCLMGGIEVAYELRNKADYIIASPAEILSEGFPYDRILGELFASSPSYIKVCDAFFDYYSISDSYPCATISLFRTDGMDNLSGVVHDIVKTQRELISRVILSDMQPYFRLNKRWFYDLGHYVKSFSTDKQFEVFISALDEVVVYHRETDDFLGVSLDPEKVYGVSTYIQSAGTEELDNYYRTLEWNVMTGIVE